MRGGARKGSGRPKKTKKREDLTLSIHPILKGWIKGNKSASALIEKMLLEQLCKSGSIEINNSGIPVNFPPGSILIRHRESGCEDIVRPGPKFFPIGATFDGQGYTKEDNYEVVCHLDVICPCDACQDADSFDDLRYSLNELKEG